MIASLLSALDATDCDRALVLGQIADWYMMDGDEVRARAVRLIKRWRRWPRAISGGDYMWVPSLSPGERGSPVQWQLSRPHIISEKSWLPLSELFFRSPSAAIAALVEAYVKVKEGVREPVQNSLQKAGDR